MMTDVSNVTDVTNKDNNSFDETQDSNAEVSDVTDTIPPVSAEERPCYRVYDTWQNLEGGGKYKPGVYYHYMQKIKSGGEVICDSWICGPLYVEAQSFDRHGNNFGRLLRFKNTNQKWRTWAMPMELLAGSGENLRALLLSMGLDVNAASGRKFLLQYIQAKTPYKKVQCVLKTGWCHSSFVLPDQVIGPDADEIIYQSGECPPEEHGQSGSVENWRQKIATKAINNPMLALGLSGAFAGPMLGLCKVESGGIHLVGNSSEGKTSILDAACSVWGGETYRRSWRTTANGIEGAASLFNDSLLALDEISECDSKDVGKIIYSLANGYGKQRASKSGMAKPITRWKCFILSNGERTIATSMAEANMKAKAGQSVRLLDIPVKRKHGCWDDLHDLDNGAAFSDAIKEAVKQEHGRAGRAFLERLTHDQRDFPAEYAEYKQRPEFNPAHAEGQEKRAATRFAIIAYAGEIATDYGITGWPQGEATRAAEIAFQAWRSLRGEGNDERRKVLEQVSEFIQRHGDSRFSDVNINISDVRDRAGYWRDEYNARIYLFTTSGMREALKGFDFKSALNVLEEVGAITANSTRERSKPTKVNKRSIRLYEVKPDALELS